MGQVSWLVKDILFFQINPSPIHSLLCWFALLSGWCEPSWAVFAVSSSNIVAKRSGHSPSLWLAILLERAAGLTEDPHCLLSGSSSIQYKVRNVNLTKLAPRQRLLTDVYGAETGAWASSTVKPGSASKLPDTPRTRRLHPTAQSLQQPKRQGNLTSKHSLFGERSPARTIAVFCWSGIFPKTFCKGKLEKMLGTVAS